MERFDSMNLEAEGGKGLVSGESLHLSIGDEFGVFPAGDFAQNPRQLRKSGHSLARSCYSQDAPAEVFST